MHIHLITIGKVKEPYLRDGIAEYMKRLSGFCTVRITEFAEERLKEHAGCSEISEACTQEGKNLIRSAESSGFIIALDPAGSPMMSGDFADLIKKKEIEGLYSIALLIGGPHGLSRQVRERADLRLSLSSMTFPHQMVRFIILEQIYRAYTINKGLPYHR